MEKGAIQPASELFKNSHCLCFQMTNLCLINTTISYFIVLITSNANVGQHTFFFGRPKATVENLIIFFNIGTQRLNYWTETENKTFLFKNAF